MKELTKIPSNADARGTAMCSRDLNFYSMMYGSFLSELGEILCKNNISLSPLPNGLNKNKDNG